jgi:DnaK suppressor protein
MSKELKKTHLTIEDLSDAQIEEYRVKIVSKQAKITQEIKELNDGLRDNKESPSDPIDAASAVEARNSALAQIAQKNKALKETTLALSNFNEFGYCLTCGDEIEVKRLDFNAATTECFECKSRSEHSDKVNRIM